MIPTYLKVKVCNSQRTFILDQSSRSTTVQSYGCKVSHSNCHKSWKIAPFSGKPNSSCHNSLKFCASGLLSRYAMYLQPNLLGTKSGVLLLTGSWDRLNFIPAVPAKSTLVVSHQAKYALWLGRPLGSFQWISLWDNSWWGDYPSLIAWPQAESWPQVLEQLV